MTDASLPRTRVLTLTVRELLDSVLSGAVRVPGFHRFRWDAAQIRLLFDSIYRGYPIGSMLLWERAAPAARLSFGPVSVDAPQHARAYWVIDGHHRITALTAVLLHAVPSRLTPARDGFALFFDLERETFVHADAGTVPPHWLPLSVLLSASAYVWPLSIGHLDAEFERRAKLLRERVLSYQLPAIIVEAADERVLRTVFMRLNTGGTPVTGTELFDALVGEFDRPQHSTLAGIADALLDLRFGRFEERLLRGAVQAVVAGHGDKEWRELRALGPEALERTVNALRTVIVFLRRDVGIPHLELLPNPRAVIPLARFFDFHPEPLARSRELLARWFWRAAVSELSPPSAPERLMLSVIDDDEEESVQRLLSQRKEWPLHLEKLSPGGFNLRQDGSKIEANALLSLRPRNLRTGEELDPVGLLEAHGEASFVHFVPRLFSLVDVPHSIATRIFHPPEKETSMLPLLRQVEGQRPSLLESHALSKEVLNHLFAGAPLVAVMLRAEHIRKLIIHFVQSRTRRDDSDRPSIDSLIVPD